MEEEGNSWPAQSLAPPSPTLSCSEILRPIYNSQVPYLPSLLTATVVLFLSFFVSS